MNNEEVFCAIVLAFNGSFTSVFLFLDDAFSRTHSHVHTVRPKTSKMPFRLGSMPSKRTVDYLSQGKILLRPQVKVVVLAYNTSAERSAGAK